MKRRAHRHVPAIAGSVLAAAFLYGPGASAVPITASVQLTNGSLGTIDLSDSDTSSTASVQAAASSTVTGAATGITLGEVYAEGTPDGLFSLGAMGQDTHAHEASFQFIETVSNTTSIAQLLTMDFLIDAGELRTVVREIPPEPNGFLTAGFAITISFDGSTVFESSALLRQVRTGEFSSTATVARTGTSLGGVLEQVPSFADEFLFSWDAYAGSLNLGVLDAGASGVLQYDARVYVAAEGDRFGGTHASIGDPLSVAAQAIRSSPIELTLTQAVSSVPEPASLALLGSGLLWMSLLRRRRPR